MPKGVLTFDLPGERPEFDAALNGGKAIGLIWEFNEELRRRYKHGDIQETDWDSVWDLYRKTVMDELDPELFY